MVLHDMYVMYVSCNMYFINIISHTSYINVYTCTAGTSKLYIKLVLINTRHIHARFGCTLVIVVRQ